MHVYFRDKLSHGNPRVSGGGQVDRDRTGKMSSRKMGISCMGRGFEEAAEDRRSRAGGIVLPNASLTRKKKKKKISHRH